MRWKCGLGDKKVVILFMTPQDLKQIGNIIDKKFDERLGKLEDKFDKKFEEQDKKLDKKFDERFEEQDKKLDKKFDERFDKFGKLIFGHIKEQFELHDEKLETKLFTWKSEVIDAVDALASEMKDSQDFRLITTNQIVENRERTDRLEKKVFGVVTSV